MYLKRQDPNGAYAAVIPKWIAAMQNMMPVQINGDGTTSRDFCYIDNVIQANILAAHASHDSKNQIYNIAVGDSTTLNELFEILTDILEIIKLNIRKNQFFQILGGAMLSTLKQI